MLLAATSPRADADPHISSFRTYALYGTPSTPTVPYPFYVELRYDDQMPPWAYGRIYETTGGTETLLADGCNYYSCQVQVGGTPMESMANPPTRTFRAVLYSSGVPYDSRDLVVNQRRMRFDVTL